MHHHVIVIVVFVAVVIVVVVSVIVDVDVDVSVVIVIVDMNEYGKRVEVGLELLLVDLEYIVKEELMLSLVMESIH